MSITAETAKQHANDPAVLCCRAEEGLVIGPANLEDPAIFDELVDSGLLNLDGCLTIGQILGAKLTKTCDSLTPVTADVIDAIVETKEDTVVEDVNKTCDSLTPVTADVIDAIVETKEDTVVEDVKEEVKPAPVATQVQGGRLKIHIGEGKDINIEIPVGGFASQGGAQVVPVAENTSIDSHAAKEVVGEAKVVRSLTRKHYKITEVKRGPETKIEGTVLYIREGIEEEAVASQNLVNSLKIDIITPDKYNTYSETIMDVQPIAAKDGEDELGLGTTRVIDGVVMMVTGTDANGVQIGEFGSSEGILEENIMWGRPGCPEKGEIFIKTEVIIKEHTNMERPGPLAAHAATDFITQEIREALKKLDDELVVDTETFEQVRRPGKKKVVIVKEIMGQGAMHDNLIVRSILLSLLCFSFLVTTTLSLPFFKVISFSWLPARDCPSS